MSDGDQQMVLVNTVTDCFRQQAIVFSEPSTELTNCMQQRDGDNNKNITTVTQASCTSFSHVDLNLTGPGVTLERGL